MTGQQTRGPFLGRESELAVLTAALDEAEAGRGGLVLLGGEPGIGKSRLADELAADARQRGMSVLWGRAWEDAGAPPYWPWVQVLRSHLRQTDAEDARRQLGPGAADIVQMLPEVRELIPELPPPASAESDAARFQLFDSTTSFLRAAGADRAILVVLDDLHAADTSSLQLLRFVSGQLGEMRLLVVATYRDVELRPSHPLTDVIADLVRAPTTRTTTLKGLRLEALKDLIGATTGTAATEPLVAAVARGTKGNPLYATEALRLLSSEGRLAELAGGPSQHLAVPPGVRAVIGRRLERLAPETRELLAIGAVIGPELDGGVLAHVGELEPTAHAGGIDEAMREGLLLEVAGAPGRYRFSHDLVRETLYDETPPQRRRALHRRVAEHLERTHGSAVEGHLAELAYHFYEGERDASTDRRAVDYARRAGAGATRSLAFEEGARLYRIALAALERTAQPAPAARLEILLALGDALSRAGGARAAREVLVEASEIAKSLGSSRELALAVLGFGGALPWVRPGRETRLIPLLQDALVHLGGADDALRVRLLTRLACAWRSSPEQQPQSDALSRQAVDLARALDDRPTLAYALIGRFYAIWWPDNPHERLALAREVAEIAEDLGDGERLLDAHVLLWLSHAELADMTAARRETAELRRVVSELRLPTHVWLGIAPFALTALMEGDYAAAEPLVAEEGETTIEHTLAHDDVSAVRFHRFLLRREQGRLAEVEAQVRAAVDEFPWYPLHRSALACLLAELGRAGEAAGVLEELGRDAFAALYRDNEWLLGACVAADAAARLRDEGAAAVLYAQLLPLAGRHAIGLPEGSVGAVDRYLGLLAEVLGRHDDAVRHIEDAVHINERMGARPWTAHSRHDLADALRARNAPGDLARAADLDGIALSSAQALGMPVLEARIAAAAVPAPAADPGVGVFRREGEYWTIGFDGEAVRMKHSKGLAYIARLLAHPGMEMHAIDLTAIGGRGTSAAAIADAGLRVADDGDDGPLLDDAAKAAYRARVEELRAEIAEAEEWNDTERAARARQELDAVASQLASSVGLGGRDRRGSSASERARISVTRAIRGALERLAVESPALARHLDATLRTGTYCSYTPDPRAPMTWHS